MQSMHIYVDADFLSVNNWLEFTNQQFEPSRWLNILKSKNSQGLKPTAFPCDRAVARPGRCCYALAKGQNA